MKNEKVDLRKISAYEVQNIKTNAIRLRHEGIPNKEVAQKLNLDPTVLSRWYNKYVKNYKQPQEIIKRGRKQGTHKKLRNNQEDKIINELQTYSGLLDKERVQKIIEEQYKMKVPINTIGDYLKKWGVNSSFIKEFENNFVEKIGFENFQLTKQQIMKRQGIIIWLTIVAYELESGMKIYSVSTRFVKNKLVFKVYKKRVQPIDVVEFINQVATFFTKQIYAIFSTDNIEFLDKSYQFEHSDKITFIHD